MAKVKCKGSGTYQAVDWNTDNEVTEEFPKGHPGASVCVYCNYGVLLVRGSISNGVSQLGRRGKFGKLRVHYVDRDLMTMSYKR